MAGIEQAAVRLPDALEPAGNSALEQVEREHIIRVLRETGWVVSKTAVRLGIPRTTLNAMMQKLGISRPYNRKSATAG